MSHAEDDSLPSLSTMSEMSVEAITEEELSEALQAGKLMTKNVSFCVASHALTGLTAAQLSNGREWGFKLATLATTPAERARWRMTSTPLNEKPSRRPPVALCQQLFALSALSLHFSPFWYPLHAFSSVSSGCLAWIRLRSC